MMIIIPRPLGWYDGRGCGLDAIVRWSCTRRLRSRCVDGRYRLNNTRSRCVQHATILALCRLKKIEVWRVWEDERWQVERWTHHDTDTSTIHKTNRFTYTNNLRIDIIPLDGRRSLVWKLKSLVVVRGPRRIANIHMTNSTRDFTRPKQIKTYLAI